MLNITTAKPLLIAIDEQIKNRSAALKACLAQKTITDGINIANHIGELKELRYQLAMTPERVIYSEER